MLNPKRILILEAHPDDGALACGGIIARLKRENKKCIVIDIYMCPCLEDKRNKGIIEEHKKSCNILGIDSIIGNNFQRNKLETIKQEIRDLLYGLNNKYMPDLIFTHSVHDWHQDHSCIGECSLNVFRNTALILSYESPSETPDFHPNLYVSLTESDVNKKIDSLNCFKTQFFARQYYFSNEKFKSNLIFNASIIKEQYAERFEVFGRI